MSYRIVKITSYYRDYLSQYYQANPQLASQNYEQQLAHLMEQAYGWSDFYAKNLRMLGVDAHEIVANAEQLQNTWAKENGVAATGKNIVFEQLKKMKPDVVFFQDSFTFNYSFVNKVRNEISSVKLCVGWCCSVYSQENIEEFRAFDWMFVCSENYIQAFKKVGLKAYLLRHAFEKSLLDKISIKNSFSQADCIFLGSFIPGSGFHDERQILIEKILQTGIHLDLYAHISSIGAKDLFLRKSAYAVSQILKRIGLGNVAKQTPYLQKAYGLTEMPRNFGDVSLLQTHSKSSLYGLEMFKALSRSRIGLNVHGEVAGNYAANVRIFEVTGVKSCLLTDWKKNLNELFEIDSEIVTYRSGEECIEKLRWLLENTNTCLKIAEAGQKRVLENHTFEIRSRQLHEVILSHL